MTLSAWGRQGIRLLGARINAPNRKNHRARFSGGITRRCLEYNLAGIAILFRIEIKMDFLTTALWRLLPTSRRVFSFAAGLICLAAAAFCPREAGAQVTTPTRTLATPVPTLSPTPIPTPQPFFMFRGHITAIEPVGNTLTVQERRTEPMQLQKTFALTEATIIRIDSLNKTLEDLKVGDLVTVRFRMEDKRPIALSVRAFRNLDKRIPLSRVQPPTPTPNPVRTPTLRPSPR